MDGQDIDQVIGLIGLPRSGTTLITSLLAVHSKICAVYEPWHAAFSRRHEVSPAASRHREVSKVSRGVRTIDGFMRHFAPVLHGKTTLLIKETSTRPDYVRAMDDLLESVRAPVQRRLIVPLRNPFHVFLSEFEARRKWWGDPDLDLSATEFDLWAEKTLYSVRLIAQMVRRFGAVFVSYERFVKDPTVCRALMGELDLTYEPRQDVYEQHLRTKDVKGDQRLHKNPEPISGEPVERRTLESAQIQSIISSAKHYPEILRLAELTSGCPETGVATASEFPAFAKAFRSVNREKLRRLALTLSNAVRRRFVSIGIDDS